MARAVRESDRERELARRPDVIVHERTAQTAKHPADDERLHEDVGRRQPRAPGAPVVDAQSEQSPGEAAERAHPVPELEHGSVTPAVGTTSVRHQGEQMREDHARNDSAENRGGNFARGDTRQATTPLGEPGAREDAERHQRSEGGEGPSSADRDLAELEIGNHARASRSEVAVREHMAARACPLRRPSQGPRTREAAMNTMKLPSADIANGRRPWTTGAPAPEALPSPRLLTRSAPSASAAAIKHDAGLQASLRICT